MEIADELGYQLHDRATRGQPLTVEEQTQLQAWYDKWDRIEMEQWGLAPEQEAEEERCSAELQAQIEDLEAKVAAIVVLNLMVAEQNEVLRTKIQVLKQQAANRAATPLFG